VLRLRFKTRRVEEGLLLFSRLDFCFFRVWALLFSRLRVQNQKTPKKFQTQKTPKKLLLFSRCFFRVCAFKTKKPKKNLKPKNPKKKGSDGFTPSRGAPRQYSWCVKPMEEAEMNPSACEQLRRVAMELGERARAP
jgi:hypothetical protein